MRIRCLPGFALAATLWAFPALAQSFHFTGQGARVGAVTALSADGRVAVAGTGIWTAESGFHNFRTDPEFPLNPMPMGISTDGRTVVGAYSSADLETSVFRWSGPGTFESLGRRPEAPYAGAYDADEHADVLVGEVHLDGPGAASQAFVWTAARGMELLPFADADGYRTSIAHAVSRDGRTIIGSSAGDTGTRAVYWDSSGVHVLQSLPGRPNPIDSAFAVSGNGRFIVGDSGLSRPTMWVDGVPLDLGVPMGWTVGAATAVSDNGRIVGGYFISRGEYTAAVWTAGQGAQTLREMLHGHGVSVPEGWTFEYVTAMSADGRTFGGTARHESGQRYGFVATIPTPPPIIAFALFVGVIHNRKRAGCFRQGGGVG